MTIIEINKGVYLNVENVYKFEFKTNEEEKYFLRFYSADNITADSMLFDNINQIKEWISMRIIRAAGADEILGL